MLLPNADNGLPYARAATAGNAIAVRHVGKQPAGPNAALPTVVTSEPHEEDRLTVGASAGIGSSFGNGGEFAHG